MGGASDMVNLHEIQKKGKIPLFYLEKVWYNVGER